MLNRMKQELRIMKQIFTRTDIWDKATFYIGGFVAGTGHILTSLFVMLGMIVVFSMIGALIDTTPTKTTEQKEN